MFWQCKVTRTRENILQHTKLHHCSDIRLLNLQHILWYVAPKFDELTLKSTYLVEKETLFSTPLLLKAIPSLVQAVKTLPFVVSIIAKIGPYPS